jgi:hypothetical protein
MRLVAVGLAVFALLSAAAPSAAGPASQRATTTLVSYCSPSGDVCIGVIKRSGVLRAEITTAAHYFSRYTLCVRPPRTGASGARRCGSFPVFRQGHGTWGSSVRLKRQFPLTEPGICRVTWRLASGPLGPTLRFRLR